ncbi:MAG: phenylacetate-CoA oxygenase/reductase subunit PaaK [Chitinophagaceae bacterium]|nr:phenylacetate-CoA oxygenase/reductase subunit PaaK [Chitinophagaceae bacterium]
MAVHFHKLAVKNIIRETGDCVSIEFDVPENLKQEFQYTQGQNINIRTTLHGEEVRRTYSICTSPQENKLKVAVKKVSDGLFSVYANERLKKGDVLEVMSPIGRFNTKLHPDNEKNYVAFAAGSGITPVISIIKTTLAAEPQSSFTLVYGNRNRSSIIFFEELEGLKNQYMQRFNLIHILSREKTDAAINFGRITKEKCTHLFKTLIDLKQTDEFFLCGPQEMIFGVKEILEQKGVDERHIHFELFTTDKKQAASYKPQAVSENTPSSKIEMKLDGRTFEFEIPVNSDDTILDAAMQQGADVPYACKGGVCCTCKAKLVEGKVEMDVHWGLDHEELEQGFILTCQSHPMTEKIVVDFDVK